MNFTTDDSNPATNLTVTPGNLTSLPAGWTGPGTFTCASVGTGNGCELSLTYAPTQAGSGTVVLNFGYTNDSGVALTGSVSISYAATADNAVIGTPSPSGTINAVVGQGSQTVTVTFNTNDGRPASNLAITGGLSPLPVRLDRSCHIHMCIGQYRQWLPAHYLVSAPCRRRRHVAAEL